MKGVNEYRLGVDLNFWFDFFELAGEDEGRVEGGRLLSKDERRKGRVMGVVGGDICFFFF